MSNTNHLDTEESATGTNQPDYAGIEIPAEKSPPEYTCGERREDIRQFVEAAGHPTMVNQTELAERYEVNQSTISRDLDRIDEYYRSDPTGRRDLETHSVYRRCVKGLIQQEKYREAAKVQQWYDEFRDGRVRVVEFHRRLDHLEDVAEEQRGGGLFDD